MQAPQIPLPISADVASNLSSAGISVYGILLLLGILYIAAHFLYLIDKLTWDNLICTNS
ncbi:hypothetical protein [Microcoleus sp. herbarium12]|uniref:hypothetical protein n=1 Tax=Microcoleus sp. herbarium12 TaxID=3055437 RepID=UPI002FD45F06